MNSIARLGILTLVMTLALAAFTWPSGRLEPRGLPIGVVGAAPAALAHEDFELHHYGTEADARAAIMDRDVYGAFAGRTAFVATGASPAVAAALRQAAPQARVVDLAPGTRQDPRVATLGALALPLTLIGIATGLLAFFAAGRTRERAGLILAGGAIAGVVAALLTQTWLDALPGSWPAIAGIAGLAVVAVAAPVAGLASRLGPPGIGIGAALMMLIANPWSGVTSAPELLPEPAGVIGQWLPTGAAGSALRSVAFFDGAAIAGPLVVLGAWALAGLALVAAARARAAARQPSARRACPSAPRAAARARRGSAPRGTPRRGRRARRARRPAPIASPHSSGPRGWLRPSTMPASMSAGAPTPSPSAKHASLTSWQTIRPSTSPGASPTHSTWRPSEREERLGGARGGVGRRRAARQLDEPAERGGGEEAGRGALRVELGERRLVAQQHLRAALQRRSPSSRPPQSTISAGTSSPLGVLGVRDAPARASRRVRQLVGERGAARDHDESPVAAARLRRRRVVRPVRPSSGYSYQPRPVLRPRLPEATLRAASIDGRQRGSPKDCS